MGRIMEDMSDVAKDLRWVTPYCFVSSGGEEDVGMTVVASSVVSQSLLLVL